MPDFTAPACHHDLTRCLILSGDAFGQILPLLDIPVQEQPSPEAFYQSLQQARQNLGSWKDVAQRLNLSEQEITQFTQTLRTLNKLLDRHDNAQPAGKNLTIAALRFLAQLERLKEKQPLLTYSTDLHKDGEEKQLRSLQQVRALELMIRSLINEAYSNQQALLQHLRTLFGEARVKTWLNVADRDDVLSGTLFSELSSLFVDKKEYATHYSPLYQYTPLLSFMNDKRKTLQTFLDDIRAIRNRLAHHKRVTSVHTALVNYYYQEIADPVQEAFDEGRVQVNPDRYFDAGEAEVRQYFNKMAEKMDRLGDDLQEVKERLERQNEKLDDIKQDTGFLRKNIVWVLGGIGVLIVGSVLTFGTSTRTLVNTEAIRSDVNEVGKTVAGVKKETSADPRKELANIGIAWEEKNIRAAIERGDTRVVSLFMDGGMNWKLYYAEKALIADHKDTLAVLLHHASLMDEQQGCARMNSVLLQIVDHGDALTPMQTQFLKTFCSSPENVSMLKGELDRALKFEKNQQEAYDREMAKKETADRCEHRLMANNAQPLINEAAQFSLSGSSTYSLHDTLLANLNSQLLMGKSSLGEIRKQVKDFCNQQANSKPNIAIDDNWSRSQRVIYNVVK
ncbi:STY4199 family HEPN domain-containing protein [Kosakonia sp. R1.Fl]|uniref:STY4199 family HEPN domain-containing protein n=1 Tax=Kosakonia sp. R1.Fl TaxID=2928706 RepID=UPI00201DF539|nr:STY4199 family HEPN domain-containing protein [Kosakonia sp. R1.Fl]MCL6746986.1 STY4199 family HEPN domain-containing protein [Kosakonia sp. R1.Fl]